MFTARQTEVAMIRTLPSMVFVSSLSAAITSGIAAGNEARHEAPPPISDGADRYRIPIDDSPMLGEAMAPITIVEYGDYSCPFTKQIEDSLQRIERDYPREVRRVWKDFPLS